MMGRMLAGLVLASFVLSFAPGRARASVASSDDCMAHHPSTGALAAHHPSPDDHCAPGMGQDCRTMPGCTAPVAAIAIGTVAPVAVLAPHAAAAVRAPLFHGLDALGPPTPPPNS